jgi:hypothetical protein
MLRKTFLLFCMFPVVFPFAETTAGLAGQKSAQEVLTNESVIQLLKVGLSEDLVIAKISQSRCSFDTSTAGLIALKQAGVSDRVLHFMIDPTRPPLPAAPPPTPTAAAPVSPGARAPDAAGQPRTGDPVVDSVPQESGLYYFSQSAMTKMDLRTLASAKTAGRLGSFATLGIKSVKNNAYLIGPSAKMRIKETTPVFYIRLPEGTSIDELVLVSLYVKEDRRELEVGSKGGVVGSKQGLRMEVMKPIDTQEVAPRLHKIATNIIPKGEYLFYIIGSADTIKGIQGKGYDFGID